MNQTSTILFVGESSTLLTIEDTLRTRLGSDSVVGTRSVDEALGVLATDIVHCIVVDLLESETTRSEDSPSHSRDQTRDSEASDERRNSRDDDRTSRPSAIDRLVAVAGDRPILAIASKADHDALLEVGIDDVIHPETAVEAVTFRLVNVAERYGLETRDRAFQTVAAAYDDVRSERDHLESLVECARATEWGIRHADSRAKIEERLCEGLHALSFVDFVWVARLTPEFAELAPVASVGDRSGYPDDRSLALEGEELSPAATTAITGTRTVVEDTARIGWDAGWVRTALEDGIRSICSVPLDCGGINYGCLTLCSTDRDAFDQWTIDETATLAESGAFLINRLELREGLYGNRATELEVLAKPGSDPLTALAERVDSRLVVEAFVPRSTNDSRGTLSVESPIDDFEAVSAVDGVQSVTTVSEDPWRIQVRFSEPTVADALVDDGATVRSLNPIGSRIEMTIEVPANRPVRRIVRAVEETVSDGQLLTKRSKLASEGRSNRFEDRFETELTERQLQTLQTAYYSGYFDWPREQTGEEVADALGVSQPTFTRHFRTAQRKLFELLFEDD